MNIYFIDWKSVFSRQPFQFAPEFQLEGFSPQHPQPVFLSENQDEWSFIWYKNVGMIFFCSVTIHAFDRQTAWQDSFIMAIPCVALHADAQ